MDDSLLLRAASGFWFASRLWYDVWMWLTHIWMRHDLLSYEYNMTHTHMNATWLALIWVHHDSHTYECDMTRSHMGGFVSRLWYVVWYGSFVRVMGLLRVWVRHDSLAHECDMTHSHMSATWLTHIWVRHDSLTCECDMTHPHVWHDSFVRMIWLLRVWVRHDTTHLHMSATWLTHMWDRYYSNMKKKRFIKNIK